MKTMVMLTRSIFVGETEIHTTLWTKSPIQTQAKQWENLYQEEQAKCVRWQQKYYPGFAIVGFKQEAELSQ